jgi:ElaB/YqjD/DUF883 family membrane-anchored ribosome-binding protein
MTEAIDTVSNQEKMVADLKQVIADAEALLGSVAHSSDDKVADLRARLLSNLHTAREKLAEADAAVRAKTREVAQATDTYVHDNPWKAIGVAAGAGLVIGLLIGRR